MFRNIEFHVSKKKLAKRENIKMAKEIFQEFDFGDNSNIGIDQIFRPEDIEEDNRNLNEEFSFKEEILGSHVIIDTTEKKKVERTPQQNSTDLKSNSKNGSLTSKFQLSDLKINKTPQSFKNDSQSLTQPDSTTNKEDILSSRNHFLGKVELVRGSAIPEYEISEYKKFCKNSVDYCLSQLKEPKEEIIMIKSVYLTNLEFTKEKVLILDLNETLVRVDLPKSDNEIGNKISFFEESRLVRLSVQFRPYLIDFLENLSKLYEIHIFTAASEVYTEKIAEVIDPEGKFISKIHSRNQCLETKSGLFIKDLRILKVRELKDIIIVDNFVHSFAYQLDNGIPLLPWNGNLLDTELPLLAKLLLEACKHYDVRDFLKETLNLRNL